MEEEPSSSMYNDIEERPDILEEIDHVISTGDVVLTLNYKGLTHFPHLIAKQSEKIQHITRTYLKGNLLQSLPGQLHLLKNLVEIYAPNNKITEVSDSICDLMNLQSLDISHNSVTQLPHSIGKLRSLERLRLSNNLITWLPKEIGHLQLLNVLEVMNNYIQCLPVELSNCGSLTRLLVDRNKLRWIPAQLCQLPQLEELSAAGNQLLCLPLGLGDMNSLKAVYVDNNPVLHAIPVTLSNQEIGFNSCGRWNFEPVHEAHTRWHFIPVSVDNQMKHLYLPKEITMIGDRDTAPVLTLKELSMRVVYQNNHIIGIHEEDLPTDLYQSLQCPTATCQTCSKPIFSMAFPMVFEGQIRIYRLCRLALCCSSYCVHLASLFVNLPLLFPSPTHLFMAVALVDGDQNNEADDHNIDNDDEFVDFNHIAQDNDDLLGVNDILDDE